MITSNPHDEKPGTCALCHGESHDGSEIELTEHDGEKAVGTYFVCDRCLDARVRSKTWARDTIDAMDKITEAAGMSDDLHPLSRADRVAAIIAERDALRAQLAESGPRCNFCQSAHCCSVRGDAVPPLCVTDPDGSLPLWMPWTNEDVHQRIEANYRAGLAERRVVVPELTPEERKTLCDELDARWNTGDNFGRIVDRIWDHHQRLISYRAKAIDPATECVVSRDALDECRMIIEREGWTMDDFPLNRVIAALREGRG